MISAREMSCVSVFRGRKSGGAPNGRLGASVTEHLQIIWVFAQDRVTIWAMKAVIDDLPVVVVSCLRKAGVIGRETKTTVIGFEGSDVEFVVEVTSKKFPCGGDWSMFLCPICGPSRRLRMSIVHTTFVLTTICTGDRLRIGFSIYPRTRGSIDTEILYWHRPHITTKQGRPNPWVT